jgi:hypothetical protein
MVPLYRPERLCLSLVTRSIAVPLAAQLLGVPHEARVRSAFSKSLPRLILLVPKLIRPTAFSAFVFCSPVPALFIRNSLRLTRPMSFFTIHKSKQNNSRKEKGEQAIGPPLP